MTIDLNKLNAIIAELQTAKHAKLNRRTSKHVIQAIALEIYKQQENCTDEKKKTQQGLE